MKQGAIEKLMAEGKVLYPDKEQWVIARIEYLKEQIANLEKFLEESRRRKRWPDEI